jgi:2-hydroxychromene-2-carboxylate isomerase
MNKQLHFWFDFGSTYSYPAVMRIQQLIENKPIDVLWQPFALGVIFQQQGLKDTPFNSFPVKGQYMWRDMARICQQANLPLNKPSVFPRNGMLPARVVANFTDQPWIAAFIQAVYQANFVHDLEISQPEVIAEILASLGLDAAAILAQATSDEGKLKLKQQTELAIQQGVFGAPFFLVDGEPFWGNDRLEQAIEFASK